ncbi:MAG: NADH-quinone oxidoreductase subunit NuoK [Chloroflexi bacterium]|nr:NADH-quinone oxidoreductase subunit NuoK [Chloroflexota bacterium]
MSGPPLQAYLLLGAVLFGVGLFGVFSQRGAVMILMSIEIILNAALLNLVAFWRFSAPAEYGAQVFFIVMTTIGAIEMAVGLAIVLMGFRNRGSQYVDRFMDMRG